MSGFGGMGTNVLEHLGDGYEVYYKKLKARASNFMSHFAITLAWADLIARRTALDGPSEHKEWVVTTYGE